MAHRRARPLRSRHVGHHPPGHLHGHERVAEDVGVDRGVPCFPFLDRVLDSHGCLFGFDHGLRRTTRDQRRHDGRDRPMPGCSHHTRSSLLRFGIHGVRMIAAHPTARASRVIQGGCRNLSRREHATFRCFSRHEPARTDRVRRCRTRSRGAAMARSLHRPAHHVYRRGQLRRHEGSRISRPDDLRPRLRGGGLLDLAIVRGARPSGRCYFPASFSTCPPNSKRMAESSLSANSASPRELKRS